MSDSCSGVSAVCPRTVAQCHSVTGESEHPDFILFKTMDPPSETTIKPPVK